MIKNELIDVYDINKNKTGKTKLRYKEPLEPGEYMIGVQAIIINSENKILISQRSAMAPLSPLEWECNGGGLRAGETFLDGIVREIREELGIELEKDKIIYLKTAVNGFVIKEIYVYRKDVSIDELEYPDNEAQNAKWVTIDEFMDMFNNGEIVANVNFNREDYKKALELLNN